MSENLNITSFSETVDRMVTVSKQLVYTLENGGGLRLRRAIAAMNEATGCPCKEEEGTAQ